MEEDERNRNSEGSSGRAKVKLCSLVSTIIKAVDLGLSINFELFRCSKDSDSSAFSYASTISSGCNGAPLVFVLEEGVSMRSILEVTLAGLSQSRKHGTC